ncbi:twin-arginine translocation signal domain-containing protein [Streptomyces sp. NBC_01261]|uniref:twin-arginine translocation signal domain-containing protein n=1 Tax=Streptomyces sp. NBC_01261 TaxID=2903802 RepID=UPI003FCED4BC
MPPRAGAPLSRRRFLALSAAGSGVGAMGLNGCALQVSTGVSGPGETVTVMVKDGDIGRRHVHLRHLGGHPGRVDLQAAASLMYVVPVLLIFLVAQRGFVAGMSTSGLK